MSTDTKGRKIGYGVTTGLIALGMGGSGVMSLIGPLVVGGLILGWNKQRQNALPSCKRGNCSVDHYQFVSVVDGNVQYQCRCGDIYLMNGRRFFTFDQEGKPVRYKIKRFLRGWINDSALPLP